MNQKKGVPLTEKLNRLFQRVFDFAIILAVGISIFYWGPKLVQEQWFKSLSKRYSDAVHSVLVKASRLRHDEEENARLRLENTQLSLKVQSGHFDCALKSAAQVTHEYELKLSKETGHRVGRTLAGIKYKVPDHLSPVQLYSLGLRHLKAHDFEKTAVDFTSLTGLADVDTYKTPQNFLITGVAWYHAENYLLADFYFDESLKPKETPANAQFQAQARLWKALVAKRLKNEEKSQNLLRELVDHNPHSVEVGWINVSEGAHEKESE